MRVVYKTAVSSPTSLDLGSATEPTREAERIITDNHLTVHVLWVQPKEGSRSQDTCPQNNSTHIHPL